MHKADKRYIVEYNYADTAWMTEIWADDWQDAQRKLRALATNGKVCGEAVLQVKLSGPFARFFGWLSRWKAL